MTFDDSVPLRALRDEFRRTSTASMPIAGTILWSIAAVASLLVPLEVLALAIAGGSGLIFPLALLIDRLRGRDLLAGGRDNPVLQNFMGGIVLIALLWPLVLIGGVSKPLFIVLGAAVLMALVWIPYGWSADDPVGRRHAVGRSLAAYAAYLFVPAPWTATAICLVVVFAYLYSFATMRRA